jgi:adenylate cyclase
MARIRFLPDELDVEALADETLLHASIRAGIPHTHACGGNARCSTCRVIVLDGVENCAPRTEAEHAIAARLQFDAHVRLACQTRVTGPVTVRRLVLDEQDLALVKEEMRTPGIEAAGEEKSLAIMFADIRRFTAFAENLLPYDVIHALNRYYDEISRVIQNHGGVIDNYMGDGILAVFGLDRPGVSSSTKAGEHVVSSAINAGLEMIEAVAALKAYFEVVHSKSFDIGVGVHYGEVIVGSVGGYADKRRTVVGDVVNFASRIEAANKNAGTNFLISEAAYLQVANAVEVNQCPPWDIRGKTGSYNLFEVVRAKNKKSPVG